MKYLRFEWDKKKEKINIRMHFNSFEKAHSVFYEEQAIQFIDPDHIKA
ncbi:MAG: hypothetical protein AB1585_03785 [Thermodesulfobacteriota bacterium]